MRVVQVMFDTLTRKYLPNYGNEWVIAPNFQRLKKHCNTFQQFYGGSMPCMPARRELHTGQYNFLHRSWGPLEPFDFSVMEELKRHGVYTHLISDHSHYWEDGGATYHNRYDTWEGFRGQEGDRWMPHDGSIPAAIPAQRNSFSKQGLSVKQHYANMNQQQKEEEMSCAKTFKAGLSFLEHHLHQDQWFVQIETFDPHEPYEVPQQYRDAYGLKQEPTFNWSAYTAISTEQHQQEIAQIRQEYAALLTMCDAYLGKVLDVFDEHDLWKDTVLIVNTDHGFLLGEHDFLGKNMPPMYDELIHIPFFLHVPGIVDGQQITALCQTTDIPATLLDLFQIKKPAGMQGKSLLPVSRKEAVIQHDAILYGVFGSYVCMNNGEHVYVKAPGQQNQPLYEYTLMPTRARGFFGEQELANMSLATTEQYSHHLPVCRIPAGQQTICGYHNQAIQDLIFEAGDEEQDHPILDEELKHQLNGQLIEQMEKAQAPLEQYERLHLR